MPGWSLKQKNSPTTNKMLLFQEKLGQEGAKGASEWRHGEGLCVCTNMPVKLLSQCLGRWRTLRELTKTLNTAACLLQGSQGTELRHLEFWGTGASAQGPMITGTSDLFAGAVTMSLRDSRPQALWVQALFPPMTLSSPATMSVLNVLIEEIIFGDILGINRTLDNKFSPHCSPVDDFNQIHEVLFGFEASYKFSVIRRPAAERNTTSELSTA